MTPPSTQKRAFSRDELREIDRRAVDDFGLPGIVLMENAGRGAAQVLIELDATGPVVICAGKGNNGGDGFVVARHLENRGVPVRVLLFCAPSDLRGDAAVQFHVIKAAGTPFEVVGNEPNTLELVLQMNSAEWIVDGLLGTGAQGEVRPPNSIGIAAINQSSAKVLALDVPSGMDCDSGRPLGECVIADETATFVGRKVGFDHPAAAALTGRIWVIDIGVPHCMLSRKD